MTTKKHKELKTLMSRISNAANTIKRATYECRLDEDSRMEMHILTLLVEKARVLMDTSTEETPHGSTAGTLFIHPLPEEIEKTTQEEMPEGEVSHLWPVSVQGK